MIPSRNCSAACQMAGISAWARARCKTRTEHSNSLREIVRTGPDGADDLSFPVVAILFQSTTIRLLPVGTNSLILGDFTSVAGQKRAGLAMLDASWQLTPYFAPSGPDGAIDTVIRKADGNYIVSGMPSAYDGQRCGFAEIDSQGRFVRQFGNSDFRPNWLAEQADGRILAGSTLTLLGLRRYHPDGSRDTSFQNSLGPYALLHSFAVLPDGCVLVGGDRNGGVNSPIPNALARVLADGSVDPTFVAPQPAWSQVTCVAVQPDGRILVSGNLQPVNSVSQSALVRLLPDGALDPTFTAAFATSAIRTMVVQPDGKILVAGQFDMTAPGGIRVRGISRFLPDGSLDPDFEPGSATANGANAVTALALQADGRILVGGNFWMFNGVQRPILVRLEHDGAIDSTFNNGRGFERLSPTGTAGEVRSLIVEPDAKVLVGGGFAVVDGQLRHSLVRLELAGNSGAPIIAGPAPATTRD
jgi:uncharacterized delta-60 repeat protein